MVSALDEAVGNITQTLKDKGIWDNTILIFSTGGSVYVNHTVCCIFIKIRTLITNLIYSL